MPLIKEILEKIEYTEFAGDAGVIINELIPLDENNMRQDVLFWCNEKNIDKLQEVRAGTVILPLSAKDKIKIQPQVNYIFCHQPRLSFMHVLKEFFAPSKSTNSGSNNIIHPSVKMGKNVILGEYNVIEENCIIGDNVVIGHNNVIGWGTVIENNVVIGSNNTIGGDGFGYEKNKQGKYEKIPHIGNVIIRKNVEIGNNNCIDRAVLGSTVLGENVKVDNLVHIAHGVQIEENSLVIAHAMIGGSAQIGKNVWIAPGALIINKGKIEDNALIGMGAVVIKNVGKNQVVAGNPAKFLKNLDDDSGK